MEVQRPESDQRTFLLGAHRHQGVYKKQDSEIINWACNEALVEISMRKRNEKRTYPEKH